MKLIFLSDPIYDWLIKPEEVLIACADLDKEIKEQNKPKQKLVTIIQQPQPQPLSTGYYKKVTYRRGPYKKIKTLHYKLDDLKSFQLVQTF